MQKLVSIIIPTYNGADKICAAVDSVLNQTYENIEVIVVDDNGEGTENQRLTAKAMEKYRDNPKVQYLVHKVNKNGSAARNTGIRASKGEFLGFLDDDDLFLPEKTQKEVDLFNSLSDEYGLVYGSFIEHMNDRCTRTLEADSTENFLYRFLCNEVIACSSTVMIRRKVLETVVEWDESFRRHQDLEFFARVADSYKVACVKDICIEKFKLDRNMPKGKTYEEYRLHYLAKMKPIIEKFTPKQQKRLYNIHRTEIGKCYLKEKDIKNAAKWAFKTSNPLKTLFIYAKDGIKYFKRNS